MFIYRTFALHMDVLHVLDVTYFQCNQNTTNMAAWTRDLKSEIKIYHVSVLRAIC